MIIDVTGIELTPGNGGKDCLGNGLHELHECCCDECPYYQCCIAEDYPAGCKDCNDMDCPRIYIAPTTKY